MLTNNNVTGHINKPHIGTYADVDTGNNIKIHTNIHIVLHTNTDDDNP